MGNVFVPEATSANRGIKGWILRQQGIDSLDEPNMGGPSDREFAGGMKPSASKESSGDWTGDGQSKSESATALLGLLNLLDSLSLLSSLSTLPKYLLYR